MYKRPLLISLALLLLLSLTAPSLIFGQGSETILTIAVPDWMRDIFTQEMFSDFEAAHPGVKVVIVSAGENYYLSPAAYDLEEHLTQSETYAKSADVLYVTNNNLSVEATRAGFFLDLAPLVAGDPDFNESDFFPAIWQSFQWDNHIWAMPLGASVMLLVYDMNAFDAAGLPYPSPSWTVDDLLNAARALTQKNDEGEITIPGFMAYDTYSLLRSLLGEGFYDESVLPNSPDLVKPELVALLETWYGWQSELNNMAEGGYRPDTEIPMVIEQPYRLYSYNDNEENANWAATLLPGNRAGLSVTGFAISAGTLNPELAYELTNYLTTKPEAVARFVSDFPARQSMIGVEPEEELYIMPEVSPEFQPLIDEALANALPYSEVRYGDYVQYALGMMGEHHNGYDAETALEEVQNKALAALEGAEARGATAAILVSTPVPTPVLASGEVALNFGLTMWSSPLPNQAEWDQLVADFVAADPEVGHLVLDTNMGGMEDIADVTDCFFLPYNRISSSPETDPKLLNLDPFMSADPNYDPNDALPGVVAQLQRDNKTWGYPIIISPNILWYEPGLFEQAGAMSPTEGWSIEAFAEALNMIKMASDEDALPPFIPTYDNTYLLMLTAAYGGLPFDTRTDPPTINLTDSATVDALRQTLDLAKAGLIDYQPLYTQGGGGGGWGPGMIPVTADQLMPGGWRLQYRDQSTELPPAQIVSYPYGSQYMPISYQVGAAYISVNTPNPEACYRWISTLAQHTELFMTMPAFQSQIESPALAASQGEDIVAFYRQYVADLQAPNAVNFSNTSNISIGGWIEQLWFNKALDHYVLEDGDLQADLAEAESFITSFRECTANIPPLTTDYYSDREAWEAYYKQFTDCATKLDPELTEWFAPVE